MADRRRLQRKRGRREPTRERREPPQPRIDRDADPELAARVDALSDRFGLDDEPSPNGGCRHPKYRKTKSGEYRCTDCGELRGVQMRLDLGLVS